MCVCGSMRIIALVLLAALPAVSGPADAKQADQPAAAASAQTQQPAAGTQSESTAKDEKKRSPLGFLIIGTVFDEKALSFPGVRVRVRRVDEKKFRWETYTNSRGEFAVRVPEGFDYEVVVRAKNYQDQSKNVTTSDGDIQQRLSIKLEPVNQGKAGAKS